ncbi:hypothetical protein HanPI659440_Chr13g0491231 [Helianthus annuus]|nr:hypothetical protein HanPI659440_Chr13g0491231 [Helianthus annuus]
MFVRIHAPSRRMDYSHVCLCLGSWVLLYYVTCFTVICCHVCLVFVMICLICLYASDYVQYLLSVDRSVALRSKIIFISPNYP